MLAIKNLTVSYGLLKILDDISFSIEQQQWLMIVGPNGAGKSTVINAITQGVSYTGEAIFAGKNLAKIRPSERARNIGVLAQNHNINYSFTVEEVVRLGRYCWNKGPLTSLSDSTEDRISQALEFTGMSDFRHHSVLTLSGGELQRTFLAQLFAQDPQLLILDEPTNHLDLVYQKQIFELISIWLEQPGKAVISVVHDLSMAKAYGTDAVLMNNGRIAAAGSTDSVLSRSNLQAVYKMDVYEWMKTKLESWN